MTKQRWSVSSPALVSRRAPEVQRWVHSLSSLVACRQGLSMWASGCPPSLGLLP
jgi:hypothetical protein